MAGSDIAPNTDFLYISNLFQFRHNAIDKEIGLIT